MLRSNEHSQIERDGYIPERGVADLRKLGIIKGHLRKRHPGASEKQLDNWARFSLMKGKGVRL